MGQGKTEIKLEISGDILIANYHSNWMGQGKITGEYRFKLRKISKNYYMFYYDN